MPVNKTARFRFAKRLVFRISWLFLRNQVQINHTLIEVNRTLTEQIRAVEQRLEDAKNENNAMFANLATKLDFGIKNAYSEINDHLASSQSEHAEISIWSTKIEKDLYDLGNNLELFSQLPSAFSDLKTLIHNEATEMHLTRVEAQIIINRVRNMLPSPTELQTLPIPSSPWNDLYLEFEELFRGSSTIVKHRLASYLDLVKSLEIADNKLLDIGCGRGDWLDLLAAEGIPSYGVDTDESSVSRAKSRKVDARLEDAFDHLRTVDAGTISAITAFHIVEHLGINEIISLFDLSFRALVPGGILIIETPNPENLIVGTNDFYLDPTHRHPIPPALLKFLVGTRGFSEPTIQKFRRSELGPVSSDQLNTTLGPEIAQVFSLLQDRLLAAEDYAVIATKS